MIHWCFNCNGYTEAKNVDDKLFCIICGKLTGVKSNDPSGHPDNWMFEEDDKT